MFRNLSMRIRSFTSVALCVLVLGLTGCRIQSTLVMPNGATLPYASPGQTLEWRPQATTEQLYIVFNGVSPCADQWYAIGPKPAQCKVLKEHNGYFSYYITPTQPPPKPKPVPTPKDFTARSCAYCQIYIGPGNNGSGGPSLAGDGRGSGGNMDGTSYPPLQVACETDDSGKKTAVVENPILNGVLVQDQIMWVSSYPGNPITVTVPAGICSGGQSGTTFTAEQICTVTGTPGTYSYSVKLDQCANPGTGTLKINSTVPTP